MNDVRIVSGWSNPGGSTVAFINLCNLFNNNGIDCTFYGPHDWHLDKCQSSSLNKENPLLDTDGASFIFHFSFYIHKAPAYFTLSCGSKKFITTLTYFYSFFWIHKTLGQKLIYYVCCFFSRNRRIYNPIFITIQ